jgi:hypothetical protein
MHPCVYGIDFPDRSKLMAANHSLEEIRRCRTRILCITFHRREWSTPRAFRRKISAWRATTGSAVPYDPKVDKLIIERRNGQLPAFADAIAKERAQIRLL